MTKQEAKTIALEKLRYYETLPEIQRFVAENLPDYIFDKVVSLHNYCPLCELFCHNPRSLTSCKGCPLICPSCNDHSDEGLQKNIALLEAWKVEAL